MLKSFHIITFKIVTCENLMFLVLKVISTHLNSNLCHITMNKRLVSIKKISLKLLQFHEFLEYNYYIILF
jgi:hypothetical protein